MPLQGTTAKHCVVALLVELLPAGCSSCAAALALLACRGQLRLRVLRPRQSQALAQGGAPESVFQTAECLSRVQEEAYGSWAASASNLGSSGRSQSSQQVGVGFLLDMLEQEVLRPLGSA